MTEEEQDRLDYEERCDAIRKCFGIVDEATFHDPPGLRHMKTMDNNQPKSDTPQLTVIAAMILTGLLASGDYTDGPEAFPPVDEAYKKRARVRPEAMADAVGLTIQLAQAMDKLTRQAAAPPPESGGA